MKNIYKQDILNTIVILFIFYIFIKTFSNDLLNGYGFNRSIILFIIGLIGYYGIRLRIYKLLKIM